MKRYRVTYKVEVTRTGTVEAESEDAAYEHAAVYGLFDERDIDEAEFEDVSCEEIA
jgi:hypothetical protein